VSEWETQIPDIGRLAGRDITPGMIRHAAAVVIATGMNLDPADPCDYARGIAEAVGLVPYVPGMVRDPFTRDPRPNPEAGA